jgi:hypothetical protein
LGSRASNVKVVCGIVEDTALFCCIVSKKSVKICAVGVQFNCIWWNLESHFHLHHGMQSSSSCDLSLFVLPWLYAMAACNALVAIAKFSVVKWLCVAGNIFCSLTILLFALLPLPVRKASCRFASNANCVALHLSKNAAASCCVEASLRQVVQSVLLLEEICD